MNKKSIIFTCAFLLVIGILIIILSGSFGRKPFAKLSYGDVMSAELFIVPPDATVLLTNKDDIVKLTGILNEIIIYREDDSGRDYDGQLVQVTIALKNGETHTIGAYGSFLFLNGKCYRTKNEPSQKLNAFGNGILNMYPQNETVTSFSPDGKYRAEAYGTNTAITAGGLYPYEGIRIISTENDDVIWEMESGGYTVSFTWSPDSRYAGIYYTGRIWGESIIVDIVNKETISLPELDEIAARYNESEKPQESRPDPYFEIRGWEDPQTVIVDFSWTKENGEEFSGQYTYNIKTKSFREIGKAS